MQQSSNDTVNTNFRERHTRQTSSTKLVAASAFAFATKRDQLLLAQPGLAHLRNAGAQQSSRSPLQLARGSFY